jgi:hypothetical protein
MACHESQEYRPGSIHMICATFSDHRQASRRRANPKQI